MQNRTQRSTPIPRIEIKIPDPAENWTRAAGLEGRDSTDHDTAMDQLNVTQINYFLRNIQNKEK